MNERFYQTVLPVLSPRLASAFKALPASLSASITEIRLRSGWPPRFVTTEGDESLSGVDGQLAANVSKEEIQQILRLMSQNSLYAFSEQLTAGYLTIAGGHRVGVAGQAILSGGKVTALSWIRSLTIRIAREVPGCADPVLPYLFNSQGNLLSLLIISPPRCGKTTLLRDIARQLSEGIPALDISGKQVGVVDERSEIAACRQGVPTMNLGPRIDVLDGCPKAIGMMMLIRSMAPEVIITDELGREEDAVAVQEALHAGVAVIASVHGAGPAAVEERPFIGDLLRKKYFDRYLVLSDRPQIGCICQIFAAKTGEMLFKRGEASCG